MVTVQDIYKGLVGLKKKDGLYQMFRVNCDNGTIERYKSELSDTDVIKVMDEENLEKVPYYIFKEEAKRLQMYLNK